MLLKEAYETLKNVIKSFTQRFQTKIWHIKEKHYTSTDAKRHQTVEENVPCYSPRMVSFDREGKICFSPKRFNKELVPFKVPCGQCIACRLEYSKQWAVRCVHESEMYEKSSFITLTYADPHLPNDSSLYHYDFQLFFKKLRRKYGDGISYFMCGEYGELNKRPHYHACIFGVDFDDKIEIGKNDQGDSRYQSGTLDELWGKGRTELGSVTFESAAYCARYVTKKITGDAAPSHYGNRKPEYAKMSTKYAIGKKWLEKYYEDIFNHGKLIIRGGIQTSIPRYYEKWLLKNHPEIYQDYKKRRAAFIPTPDQIADNTPQRLRTKSRYHKLIIKTLKRPLDSQEA